jgi:uncharacterized membrane protein
MNARRVAWFALLVPLLAVVGYSVALLTVPSLRSPFVEALFAQRPVATTAHLASSAVALAAGWPQLHSGVRARYRALHRWLGRCYVVAVAVGGVSGAVMAWRSSGGVTAHLGFGLMAATWLLCTALAYRSIRVGALPAHRQWMTRSYAVTLAAVTLRLYLPLSLVAGISFDRAYPVISWLAWVPNLLLAEWMLRTKPVADHGDPAMPRAARA